MIKYLFLSMFLCIGTYSLAQVEELEENRPPVFKHDKYKYSWGEYIALYSKYAPKYAKEFHQACIVDQIIIECVLTKRGIIENITFSPNTPVFMKEYFKKSIKESEDYWKPKKRKGKYVDAKLVFA